MDGFLRFTCDEQDVLINKACIVDITLVNTSIFEKLDTCIIIINTIKDRFIIKLDEIKILHRFNYSFNANDLFSLYTEERLKLCEKICSSQGIDEWICDCGNGVINSVYENIQTNNLITIDSDFCVSIFRKDKEVQYGKC